MKFYYVTIIFDLQIFDNETTALLNIFEICTEMCFVSIFFLNERNITTSLLIIATFKEYCFAWYVKLSSRSIIKPFLNDMPPNMLFRFFRFLIYVYFNEAFVKNLSKNYFLIQISKIQISFQDIRIVYQHVSHVMQHVSHVIFYYLTRSHCQIALLEILGSMRTAILCLPGCDVINFKINITCLIKPFSHMTKK